MTKLPGNDESISRRDAWEAARKVVLISVVAVFALILDAFVGRNLADSVEFVVAPLYDANARDRVLVVRIDADALRAMRVATTSDLPSGYFSDLLDKAAIHRPAAILLDVDLQTPGKRDETVRAIDRISTSGPASGNPDAPLPPVPVYVSYRIGERPMIAAADDEIQSLIERHRLPAPRQADLNQNSYPLMLKSEQGLATPSTAAALAALLMKERERASKLSEGKEDELVYLRWPARESLRESEACGMDRSVMSLIGERVGLLTQRIDGSLKLPLRHCGMFHEVSAQSLREANASEDDLWREAIKDRIVIIAFATGSIATTPAGFRTHESGAHAAAIENLLHEGSAYRRAPSHVFVTIVVLVTFIAILWEVVGAIARSRRLWLSPARENVACLCATALVSVLCFGALRWPVGQLVGTSLSIFVAFLPMTRRESLAAKFLGERSVAGVKG